MPGSGSALDKHDLRAIEELAGSVDRLADEVEELNGRLGGSGDAGGTEDGQEDAGQDAIAGRVDDLEQKVTRLERDIDIVDSGGGGQW